MMKIVVAIILLSMVATRAFAQGTTGYLAGQFGIHPNTTCPVYSGLPACTNPAAQPDDHCTKIVGNVQSLYGTFTVKRPDIQVLMWVICNSVPSGAGATMIYAGERFQGTTSIDVSHVPAGISGNYCWVDWSECQNNQPYLPGDDWEYQLVVGGEGP